MSLNSTNSGDRDEAHSTYLAIFKVYGDAIHLWSHDKLRLTNKPHSGFRISCHSSDRSSSSDIQVFCLSKPAPTVEKCKFLQQDTFGQQLETSDMTIFMTKPVENSKKATFTIDLGVAKYKGSLEDLNEEYEKIGSAYLDLDPKFSSQGVQRTPVIGTANLLPIGHMQVEYLIVTNPVGYGHLVPKPEWPYKTTQLDAGHRGAGSGCRPDLPVSMMENTIASFNYAHKHGADMVELDVMCTADGIPVVYHNYTLDTSKLGATQIDELTLEDLRELKTTSTHVVDCKHSKDDNKTLYQNIDTTPFPTLEEVLLNVDKSCALNIELKWPQLLPNGKIEAAHYREINDFVDRILNCIFDYSNGRAIMLSTLNANIAIMLRLKQSQYPVMFLTTGDSQRFNDPMTKTVQNAIHFAQAFDLAGINPNAAYLTEYLVRCAQDRGLLVYAWGKIESAQAIKELKKTGINGVIYDKIDLIKPQD